MVEFLSGVTGGQRHLLGCANNVCALTCSADGQLIVSAETGKPGLIRLWNAKSQQCLALLHGEPGIFTVLHPRQCNQQCMHLIASDPNVPAKHKPESLSGRWNLHQAKYRRIRCSINAPQSVVSHRHGLDWLTCPSSLPLLHSTFLIAAAF